MRAELADLRSLLIASLAVPVVWCAVLGWDGSALLAGNDAFLFSLHYRELLAVAGSWSEQLYIASVVGGVAGHPIIASPWLSEIWARIGVAPVPAFNRSTLAVQILIAFLSVRSAHLLARLWSGGPAGRRLPLLTEIAGVLLLGFAPLLAWRLGWAHWEWIVGLLALYAMLALLAAARTAQITLTLLLVAFFALGNAVTATGHQLVLYSALFGAPIALAAARPPTGPRRASDSPGAWWLVPGGVALATAGVVLPRLWPVILYATGDDTVRVLGDTVVRSHVVTTGRDLWTSLAWSLNLFDSGRDSFLLHETNVPIGPPLLLLACLVPWSRHRGLAVALVVSTALAVAFALDLSPVSDALLGLPGLGSFRIPGRVLIIPAVLVPVLAFAAWLAIMHGRTDSAEAPDRWIAWGFAAFGGWLCLVLPPALREIAGWSLVLGLVGFARNRGHVTGEALARLSIYGSAGLAALGAIALAGFAERLLPFVPAAYFDAAPRRLEAAILAEAPRLRDPLHRALFTRQLEGFEDETGWAANISTLDGYWPPPRRFLELEAALRGVVAEPTDFRFALTRDHPGYVILRHLYNVCCAVSPQQEGARVEELGPTPGPAWFSHSIESVSDMEALVERLRAAPDLAGQLRDTVFVVNDADGRHQVVDHAPVDPACADARILDAAGHRHGAELAVVRYRAPAACPLTISLNLQSSLEARVERTDGSRQPVALRAAYGSLASATVPAGEGTLHIRTTVELPVAVRAAGALGWLLLAVIGALSHRRHRFRRSSAE